MSRFYTAKELAAELQEQGIAVSVEWVRAAWKIGAPNRLRRYGRLDRFEVWLDENPGVRPRAKDPDARKPVKNRGMTVI